MFGLTAFAQSPFSDFEHNTTYALNGVYDYTGLDANILNNRSITALNGVYNYTGNNASLLKAFKVYAINGIYTYSGFTSTNKLFLGDWEFEFGAVDVWTCQDEGATAVWTEETTTPITWN